ncbi:MAG TPA: Na+/H+ antiporter subunit A [Acidimicrobiia bacterium]|nr:Na+/H+ antiporter subunit A [Acidimicrobiia bacterium]
MWLILLIHLAAAIAAPKAVSIWGRKVFLVLALAPASSAVWALGHTEEVLAGKGPATSFSWVPSLGIDIGFRLDSLSWFMVLIVGGVGAVVLVYCSRYFAARSSGLGRFAAVLTAFAGAMLGLVTSSNLIQMFVFWELTTVFSYLLIGHYSERSSSRRAAMKAILVTTFGGLALLLGVLLIGSEAGTYDIAYLIASPPKGAAVTAGLALLLVGAVTKSALIPFHFWLPAAMTAPTPVSAYLHAAAMVKAGIYLVARFAPAYALDPVWQAMVLVLGCVTLLFGGYQALRQHDLKLILAFGTVSQLGLIILLVGSPYKATALAGLALLGAHALFKASLFLTVGVVDATTGTRDIRRLNGLGRKMPATAAVTGLATASMIGLLPFAGYVAKEAALESLFDPAQSLSALHSVVVLSFVAGSVLTVAYGIRLVWGAFSTKNGAALYPIVVSRPNLLLVGPPGALAVGGLLVGLLPSLGETLIAPHADTYPLGLPGHLSLFTGFTPALFTTIAVFATGVGVFMLRSRVEQVRLPWPSSWDADLVYRHTLRRVDQLAASATALFQRGSLPFYLGVILVVVASFTGGAMLVGTSLPDGIAWQLAPREVAVGALIIAAAVLAARSRRRLKAVILTGITGYGTAMLFLLYGAPDLALTQVLVETVTLVVFVLVLRRLPVYFSNRPLVATRWVRIALGAVTGTLVAALAVVVPQYRIHEPISRLFPEEAVAYGGGYNIVNVTLVDIRAWDTVGEISVLLVAATGIASLVFLSRRGRQPSDLSTLDAKAGMLGASDPDPMSVLRERPRRVGAGSVPGKWLVGGITLAPQRRSLILEVATRIVYHTMVVFAIYLLFAGHNAPGGGFVAGLITGIALIVRYLAGGRYELSAAAPLQPGVVLGTGLFLSASLGIVAMFFGGEVLQSALLEGTLPVFGEVKLVTSVFFDFGVYLVVVGLMLDILKSLGAEIDRQGETSGHDSDRVGPVLEPEPPTPGQTE